MICKAPPIFGNVAYRHETLGDICGNVAIYVYSYAALIYKASHGYMCEEHRLARLGLLAGTGHIKRMEFIFPYIDVGER
jgi:hypothetical protein